MLRTVTVDLDYALEVLLPYFFIIKDLFGVSSEETKQYMLDGGMGLLMKELYQHFEVKVGRIEVFLEFLY